MSLHRARWNSRIVASVRLFHKAVLHPQSATIGPEAQISFEEFRRAERLSWVIGEFHTVPTVPTRYLELRHNIILATFNFLAGSSVSCHDHSQHREHYCNIGAHELCL